MPEARHRPPCGRRAHNGDSAAESDEPDDLVDIDDESTAVGPDLGA